MSPGTLRFRLAGFLAHALDARLLQELQDCPSVNLAELRRILRPHLQDLLEQDMQRRVATPTRAAVYAPWFPGHPVHETPAHAELEAIQDEVDGTQESLRNRETERVSEEAQDLQDRHGIPSNLQPLLAHGLLEVFARFAEATKARTLGSAGTVLNDEAAEHGLIRSDPTRVALEVVQPTRDLCFPPLDDVPEPVGR